MKLLFEANSTVTSSNTSLKGNNNQDNKVPSSVIASLSLSGSGNRGLGSYTSKFKVEAKTSRENNFYKKGSSLSRTQFRFTVLKLPLLLNTLLWFSHKVSSHCSLGRPLRSTFASSSLFFLYSPFVCQLVLK
jgi:hypothetical protein